MYLIKNLLLVLLSLVFMLAFIHYNNLDLKFQSLFYIYETRTWQVDRDDLLLKFIFYRLPKYIIITYGVTLIFWLAKLRFKKESFELQKKLIFLILSLVFIPVTIALLKHYSPIYCPNHIAEFGGGKFYIPLLDIFSADIFFNNNGKCFPAGHASGGFALLSLYFVIEKEALRRIILAFAICLGWIMGLYQIAKGAHFLSDTLVTFAISYIICLIFSENLLKNKIKASKY